MSRLLVLRALGLGDLLTAVPALRALRRAEPAAELVLATPAALEPLVGLVGAVDRVHHTPDLPSFRWSDEPPDLAVDLHGCGPESHRALQEARPRRLVGFDSPAAGVSGPAWRPEEHEAVRWCRLLREALGIEADHRDGLLARPAGERPAPAPVVVHPGAASGARRWPADRFAAVAVRLRTLLPDVPVLVTGSRGERALAVDVARRAGLPASSVTAGDLSLGGLAAVVADARLVLSGDTGVAHLAAAFDRPAVALFGPTPPSRWAPAWGRTTVLWRGGQGIGDPHGSRPDPRLLALGVEEVWAAVAAHLADASVRG